jgi:hypothetical protein
MTPITTWRARAVLLLAAASAPTAAVRAQAPRLPFQYAAKIVCGREALPGAVPQAYATSINIHNPNATPDTIRKSLVVTTPPGRQRPQRPRGVATDLLPTDNALSTDCDDLRARVQGLPGSFEGFVLIESTQSVDVVGVYTVPGGIDVVPIPERQRRQ